MADKTTDEYFDLINNSYAMSEIGRLLSQEEVDTVVSICDGYDDGNWGEAELQDALKEFKSTL